MSKIRVYELAKELGLDNKEILAKLRALKITVKSHMSVIPEEDIDRIRKSLIQADEITAAGGVEEKRVATGVIRRRTRPTPVETEEEEKPGAKVDLATLKQAAKRGRREEGVEAASKPEPETLEDIPSEWAEEEVEAKPKKALRRKKAEPKTPAPVEAEAGEAAPSPPGVSQSRAMEPGEPAGDQVQELKKAPPKKAARKAGKLRVAAPGGIEEPALPAPEGQEPAKEAPKAKPAAKRIYMRPTVRKTARAPEGEPIPMPGQAPPAKVVELPTKAAAAEEEAKKKKKKKKKKGKAGDEEPETELFGEAPPKKRLRRKIAFKLQRGIEGMEIADIEQMYLPSRSKITSKKKVAKKTQITTPKAIKRVIRISESISVADLARQLGVKSQEIIKTLAGEGVTAVEDQPLDLETSSLIASVYNYEIVQELFDEKEVLGLKEQPPMPEKLRPRPPVVTVMGHVDHGKTSLLDTIRKTRVTEEEAGAITQHIGAYLVETSSGRVCFIDTPGHEAFTAMRARGAEVTDIVVLVVAADDGIMPQTIEAANHARAAKVPVVVAVNKIDLPAANPQRIMQRLSEIDLSPEDWGGDTLTVQCSAKTGQGISDLLEAILLQAEMLELNADPDQPGKGFVIETRLDKGRGSVATVIVQDGTLARGDHVLCGLHYGRIRAMLDDRGQQIREAGPSIPVEIMGLSGVPEPGDVLMVVDEERKAKMVAEHRRQQIKVKEAPQAPAKVSLEELMAQMEKGEVTNLNLIIKADTHGTAEAIKQSVEKLSGDEVRVQVTHSGVGTITENDVLLASASQAVILGFMVKAEGSARKLAEQEGVEIRSYEIIYNLIDEVKASLQGLLKPVYEEQVLGRAEVRKVFHITRVGAVAGSFVTEGQIKRGALARVLRANDVVYTGKFKSLKRVQDDVREVAQGLECGIGLENFNDVQEGDIIEAYELTEVRP